MRRIWIAAALAFAGCGFQEGDVRVSRNIRVTYHRLSDLESGGDLESKSMDLTGLGRASWIMEGDKYRVVEMDRKRVKIEVLSGKYQGNAGWVMLSDIESDPRG